MNSPKRNGPSQALRFGSGHSSLGFGLVVVLRDVLQALDIEHAGHAFD